MRLHWHTLKTVGPPKSQTLGPKPLNTEQPRLRGTFWGFHNGMLMPRHLNKFTRGQALNEPGSNIRTSGAHAVIMIFAMQGSCVLLRTAEQRLQFRCSGGASSSTQPCAWSFDRCSVLQLAEVASSPKFEPDAATPNPEPAADLKPCHL